MASFTPIPSHITCFENGFSRFSYPVLFKEELSPMKLGPLTPNIVNGSVCLIPESTELKIGAIVSDNNFMLKIHYKLRNQAQNATGNFSYLSKGIDWRPSYVIKENTVEKTLSIDSRASILSSIPSLDEVTLPQLSIVSGSPDIACEGEIDPLFSNTMNRSIKAAKRSKSMKNSRSRSRSGSPAYSVTSGEDNEYEKELREEKVAELHHFIMKNVPINFNKVTKISFMDEILSIAYQDIYSIQLNNDLADNKEVPAKHQIQFPLKGIPPLPKGPVMVYLRNEQQHSLTFLTQTWLESTSEKFILGTSSSIDVGAKFNITTCDTKEVQHDEPDPKRRKKATSFNAQNQERNCVLHSTKKVGNITVTNRKKEGVKVRLEITVLGTIVKEDSKNYGLNIIEKVSHHSENLNPENLISLDLDVEASSVKDIQFAFLNKTWDKKTICISTLN